MHRSLSSIRHRAGLRFIETPAPPAGETGTPPAGGGATPPTGAPKETPPEEKTFTQAEVTKMLTKEKREGATAAANKLAEELGVTVEEAKIIIQKHNDADEATKSEAQKDREAAAREKQEAADEKTAAKVEVHQARLERAFAKVGVDLTDEKTKTKNERLLRLVTAEVGTSFEDIAAEVTEIQKDWPDLFKEAVVVKRAPNGDPIANPPKPTGGEDAYETGRKRAQAKIASSAPPTLLSRIPGLAPAPQQT